jgi:maltose alpha-D-glucosyltransferase/alpha-amylase
MEKYSFQADICYSAAFCQARPHQSKRFKGDNGEVQGGHTKAFRKDWERTKTRSNLEPHRLESDKPNSYIRYGENFILKLYRRLEPGPNPDREMLEFLTEKTEFGNTPRALGWLEYKQSFDDTQVQTTLGVLTSFTRNGTNGWNHMLDQLGLFFERALAIIKRFLPEGHPNIQTAQKNLEIVEQEMQEGKV